MLSAVRHVLVVDDVQQLHFRLRSVGHQLRQYVDAPALASVPNTVRYGSGLQLHQYHAAGGGDQRLGGGRVVSVGL